MTRMSKSLCCRRVCGCDRLGRGAGLGHGPGRRQAPDPLAQRGEHAFREPLLLRVRSGRNPRVFRAQLNGHSVARFFSDGERRRARKLRVTPSHHLRHGRNQLHVRIEKRHGHARSETTTFFVRRNRPLAAAGLPREVRAGHRIYLDGSRSRSHLAGRGKKGPGAAGGSLDTTGSSCRLQERPAGATGFSATNAKRPLFKPSVPAFRIKTTVTAADGQRGRPFRAFRRSLRPSFISTPCPSGPRGARAWWSATRPIPADMSTATAQTPALVAGRRPQPQDARPRILGTRPISATGRRTDLRRRPAEKGPRPARTASRLMVASTTSPSTSLGRAGIRVVPEDRHSGIPLPGSPQQRRRIILRRSASRATTPARGTGTSIGPAGPEAQLDGGR